MDDLKIIVSSRGTCFMITNTEVGGLRRRDVAIPPAMDRARNAPQAYGTGALRISAARLAVAETDDQGSTRPSEYVQTGPPESPVNRFGALQRAGCSRASRRIIELRAPSAGTAPWLRAGVGRGARGARPTLPGALRPDVTATGLATITRSVTGDSTSSTLPSCYSCSRNVGSGTGCTIPRDSSHVTNCAVLLARGDADI